MHTFHDWRLPIRYTLLTVASVAGLLTIRWAFGYPAFHSIVELFAVAVAIAAFMITWSGRNTIDNRYVLFLGIAYFFVACVDILHTLAYQGVEAFQGYSPTELATQLWLAGRYLQASALIIAPAFIHRRLRPSWVLGAYSVATVLLVGFVFAGMMPSALPETGGLTPFKIWSEWLIAVAFAVGLIGLLRKRDAFDRDVLRLLAGSIVALIAAEIAFMLYGAPHEAANFVGHLLRILAYFLLYRGLIVIAIVRPYDILFRQLSHAGDELVRSEMRFRATFEQATVGIAHISPNGRWLLANRRLSEITGYGEQQLFDRSPADITYPADRAREIELNARLLSGEIPEYHLEKRYVRPDGQTVWVNLSTSMVREESGEPGYFVMIAEDISARKRAEERLHRARDLSEALGAIDRAINSTFDRAEVMRRVTSLGTAVIEAHAATVWIQDDGAWIPLLSHGYPDLIASNRFRDGDVPYVAECVSVGAPLAIEDVSDRYGSTDTSATDATVTSILCVPLQFRDQRYGALTFLWRNKTHEFTAAELDFAEKLGASLALAIDNARLYEVQSLIADTLQASMLRMDECVVGVDVAWAYRSATQLTRIGGDFFDVFTLDDGRVGFVIGDVAGKGIEAAALTSIAKSTLRAFAYELKEPAAVAASVNRSISQQIDEGRFITAIYGLLDPVTGDVSFVVAGHPLPLVCDELGCTEQAATHNPPLGVFDDWVFESYNVHLHRGQRVILYSDGLIDARSDTEFFGDARVHAIVDSLGDADPQIVVDTLMIEARKLAGGSPDDDIAILAFRYTGV